jgi:hypothetical protein
LGAATEQAVSISKSADSRLNGSIDKNKTQRREILLIILLSSSAT